MSDQIEQKQAYLCQNVIEAGYDGEQFAQYCERKIGNVDIQGWSFYQLKNKVKKDKQGLKFQRSSFMKYQQQNDFDYELDIDQIDVNNNLKNQTQFQNHSTKKQIINNQCQQSSIWGPQSQAIVNLDDEFDINNVRRQQILQNNESDEFGDFSSSTSQKSSPTITLAQPNPLQKTNFKPICKPPVIFQPITPKISNHNNIINPKQISMKKQTDTNLLNVVFQSVPISNVIPKVEQIQQIVQKRKSQQLKQQKQAQKVIITQTKSLIFPQKSIYQDQSPKNKYKSKIDIPKSVKQQFFDTISCIKAKSRSLLNQQQISVQITGHEKVSRSLVLPSYIIYTVLTKPLNVEVKRKYAHFLKLRQMLIKFYPGIRLPYLQKTAWLSQTGVQQIKSQKLIIQAFMNDLLLNQELKNCRILQQFFTLKDNQALKQKFTEYQKMDDIKSIEQLCILRGQVDVSYTSNHKNYFQKVIPLIDSLESNIDKCKIIGDKLSTLFSSLIKAYTQLQGVFVDMENSVTTFNSQVNFYEFTSLESSIKGMNDYYRQLNNSVRLQARFLQRQFKNFWTYQRLNIGTIREVLDIRTKMTDYFNKNYSQNPNRNESYFNNKKVDACKINISQISKHPTVLKYQMGYFNQIAAQQTMRLFVDLSKKINNKIILPAADKHLSRVRDLSDFYKIQKKLGKSV